MDIVRDIAPWLASASAFVALVGAMLRWTSPNRLRDNIARDAEILGTLDGPAAVSMQQALDAQAERLRLRVVDGYRMSPFADFMMLSFAFVWIGGYVALVLPELVGESWRDTLFPIGLVVGLVGSTAMSLTAIRRLKYGPSMRRPARQPRRAVPQPPAGTAPTHTPGTTS